MKEKKRKITIELKEEEYQKFEEGCKKHNLDKTNYIRYLIGKDRNDLYSNKADRAINKISASTVALIQNDEDPKIQPFIMELEEGVKALWQCLQ